MKKLMAGQDSSEGAKDAEDVAKAVESLAVKNEEATEEGVEKKEA